MVKPQMPQMVYDDRMWSLIREKLGNDIPLAVEIGTRYGHWAEGLVNNFSVNCLFCIDTWPNSRWHVAKEWFKRLECHVFDTVIPLRGSSSEWAEIIDVRDINLLFVDGRHTLEAVCCDLEMWWPRVRPGGLAICHDAQSKKVSRAVLEFFQCELPIFHSGPDHEMAYWIIK